MNPEKVAIKVKLRSDILQEASLYTQDLSRTLEGLLEEFVVRERARLRDGDDALDSLVAAFGAFHAEHGLLSDEFPTL